MICAELRSAEPDPAAGARYTSHSLESVWYFLVSHLPCVATALNLPVALHLIYSVIFFVRKLLSIEPVEGIGVRQEQKEGRAKT